MTAVSTHERLSVLRYVCKPDATPIQSPTGPLVTVDAWLILHRDGCGTAKKTQDNDEEGYPEGLQGCDDTKRTAQSDRDSSSLGGARLREELAPRVSRTERASENGRHLICTRSHFKAMCPGASPQAHTAPAAASVHSPRKEARTLMAGG